MCKVVGLAAFLLSVVAINGCISTPQVGGRGYETIDFRCENGQPVRKVNIETPTKAFFNCGEIERYVVEIPGLLCSVETQGNSLPYRIEGSEIRFFYLK